MSSIEMCHSAKQPHSAYDFEGLEESLVDNNDDEDEEEEDDFGEAGDLLGIGSSVDPHHLDLLATTSSTSSSAHSAGIIFDQNLILVRDALIRDSANRTEEDIEIIVRFLAAINSNHDHMTRKRLAPHFVLAEIESRDTRVLTHDEKLDAYCIVAAGSLRHVIPCSSEVDSPEDSSGGLYLSETIGSPVDDVEDDVTGGRLPQLPQGGYHQHYHNPHNLQHYHHHQNQGSGVRYLTVGDEFGAHLNDRVVYGEIFTNENFVWVLCVPHVIFDQICGEKAFKTIKDEVTGNVIEMRTNCFLELLPPSDAASMMNNNLESGDLGHLMSQNQNQHQQQHGYLSDDYTTTSHLTDIVTSSTSNNSILPPKSLALPSSPKNTTAPSTVSPSHHGPNDNNELIRATKERLYELVLSADPSELFIEDFLLTFRIWSERGEGHSQGLNPARDAAIMADLMGRICGHIRAGRAVENCVRIVLLWMVHHFQDFEQPENGHLLETFEAVLKERGLRSQLRLFHMNLSAKSAERVVTVTRSDRNASLPFSLIGGYECSARLFIGEIISTSGGSTSASGTAGIDLRAGDRVLSINGVDCSVTPIGRAYELCRSSTHLSLQVKYDPHLFNALIEGRHENKRQIVETFPLATAPATIAHHRLSSSCSTANFNSHKDSSFTGSSGKEGGKKDSGGMWKQKVKSLVSMTTNQLLNSTSNILHNNNSNSTTANGGPNNNSHHNLNNSSSNSSLSSSSSANTNNTNSNNSANSAAAAAANFNSQQQQQLLNQNISTHPRILSYEVPEIIKIYFFENNDARFLPIHSSTTARECIQLAMREFALQSNYSSRDFALYEYSVIFNNAGSAQTDEKDTSSSAATTAPSVNASSTVVKRLADGTSDLVNNLGLNSRLYLKLLVPCKEHSSANHHHLSDTDIAKEIVKDSSGNGGFLTLDTNAIARELTARDFRLFCKIEAQQFVYDLAYNNPNNQAPSSKSSTVFARTRDLVDFERRTNEEMFWTINQVLQERSRSVAKRVKVIKKLIRIAHVAMKLNNFNLLFAILSGLAHSSVDRLKSCWEKVPGKEVKRLQKLNDLMSVHRNFVCLRQKLMEIMHQDGGERGNGGAFIIIPFFPLVKKDLMFIWMANQTYVNSKEPQTPSGDSGSENAPAPKPAKEEMLVNWEKMRLLSEKIREIQKMTNTTKLAMAAVSGAGGSSGGASANGNLSGLASPTVAPSDEPIDPNLLFRIFADATTCEDPRTFSHKRLWENQRMMKRVQSFLDETFTSVSSDEQELLSRSHSCELPQTPTSSHNSHGHGTQNSQHTAASATTRSSIASTMSSSSALSHPSPTPSSASSSSNSLSMHSDGNISAGQGGQLLYRPLRPRFGQSSPNNLRKLLALSDGSVIVPHTSGGSNSGGNSHNHHGNHHQSSSSSSTLGAPSNSGGHHHHQANNQHHPYTSARSSTSSISGGSTSSYYNNIYGCNSSGGGPVQHHQQQSSYSSGNNGTLTNNSNNSYHSKVSYQTSGRGASYEGACCPSSTSTLSPPCCSGGHALYPNQSYNACVCCAPSNGPSNHPPPMMRTASVMSTSSSASSSMMMVMPPPQTSGLMHPLSGSGSNSHGCCSTPSHHGHHSQHHSSRRQAPSKVPLPVESSSVTSFRRLEQYQQMTRYREIRHTSTTSTSSSSSKQNNSSSSRRPQLPDYTTAMQRIQCSVNGKPLSGAGAGSHHRSNNSLQNSSSGQHHREDIV